MTKEILFLIFCSCCSAILELKPPFLLGKGTALGWNIFDGRVEKNTVRVAEKAKNSFGRLVHNTAVKAREWTATYEVLMDGKSFDGFAFWFTKEKITPGNAFGANNRFEGFSVGYYSFDRITQKPSPTLALYSNDGDTNFDRTKNGESNRKCFCAVSGTIQMKRKIRVTMNQSTNLVTLFFNNGNEFVECCSASDVKIPKEIYFGVSAANEKQTAAYDIFDITVTTSDKNPLVTEGKRMSETEKKEYNKKLLKDIETFGNKLKLPTFTPRIEKFNDPQVYTIYRNFEHFFNETYFLLHTVLDSHRVYSRIAFKLATNPPADLTHELRELSSIISTLRGSVTQTINVSNTTETQEKLLGNVLDINKSLSEILEGIELLLDEIRESTSNTVEAYKLPWRQTIANVVMYAQIVFVFGFIIKQNIKSFNLLRTKKKNTE